jgi:hypothetical protein
MTLAWIDAQMTLLAAQFKCCDVGEEDGSKRKTVLSVVVDKGE